MKLSNFKVVLRLTWKDVRECYRALFNGASKLFKHLFAVFLCATALIGAVAVRAFASGGLVTEKPTYSSLSKNQKISYTFYKQLYDDISELINTGLRNKEQIIYLNRLYYFSLMLDNSLDCPSSISSGNNRFNDEYLWFYFDFCLSWSGWTDEASVGFFTVANEDGIITDVKDIKFDIDNLGFFPSNWKGRFFEYSLSNPPAEFVRFKDYYNYLYSVYCSDGTPHSEALSGVADPVISGETFKEAIEEQNKWYTPKTTSNKISYRNEEFYSFSSCSNPGLLTLYNPRLGFCNKYSSYQIYLLPFYTNGENTYYGQYQLQFWCIPETDNDGNEVNAIYLYFYDMLEAEPMIAPVSKQQITTFTSNTSLPPTIVGPILNDIEHAYDRINIPETYFTIASYPYPHLFVERHDTLREYASFSPSTYGMYKVTYPDNFTSYINSKSYTDLLRVDNNGIGSHFVKKYSDHDVNCPYTDLDDIGYYCSTEPISIVYPIDTTRIPDDYIVTINGDTIYDYSITNPETGETDTINNYVTNNYTFTDNGSGGNNGGGGTGGNVTVGGKIDVGGTVDVKVDVNVNGGGGSYDSPDMPDMDPLNDYLNGAIEESGGVRKFLEVFFSFLPPEVVSLILIGLTLVVIRICLRR